MSTLLNPRADLRQYVSALVATSSDFHKQIKDTPEATPVRTLALLPGPSVNGRFVAALRAPAPLAYTEMPFGPVRGPREFIQYTDDVYNSYNILD